MKILSRLRLYRINIRTRFLTILYIKSFPKQKFTTNKI